MTVQAIVLDESWFDVSVYAFWKWVTTALFDVQIVNLDVGFYLHHTSAKALAMVEKEKKDKCLQPCMECRHYITPMVYYADRIPGTEAVAAQQRLASLLSNKMKWAYLNICGFLRYWMSLAIVSSNTLLLHGARYKEAYI